jgi:hypothetical protein
MLVNIVFFVALADIALWKRNSILDCSRLTSAGFSASSASRFLADAEAFAAQGL